MFTKIEYNISAGIIEKWSLLRYGHPKTYGGDAIIK
jgi:hypothetical protein